MAKTNDTNNKDNSTINDTLSDYFNDKDTIEAINRDFNFIENDKEYKNLYEYLESENWHFMLLSGTSCQGKTYLVRKLLKYYSNSKYNIIYVKNNTNVDDIRLQMYENIKRLDMSENTAKLIHGFIESNENKVKKVLKDKKLTKKYMNVEDDEEIFKSLNMYPIMVIFDDIQNLDSELTTLFNKLICKLSMEGRHFYFKTVLLLQNYRSIPKMVRSNSQFFIVLNPIDSEYIEQICKEWFNKTELKTIKRLKLPRYSLLIKYKPHNEQTIFTNETAPKSIKKIKKE